MGLRGPAGKRSDELMGHTVKARLDSVTHLPKPDKRPGWYSADPEWHPEARQMYDSLKKSAVAKLLDASDIAVAYFLAGQTSRFLFNGGTNGQMFSAIMSGWSDLLATESSRRRLRIEVGVEEDTKQEDPIAAIMAAYSTGLNGPAPAAKPAA